MNSINFILSPEGYEWNNPPPQSYPQNAGFISAVTQAESSLIPSFASSSTAARPQQGGVGFAEQSRPVSHTTPTEVEPRTRSRGGRLDWEKHKPLLRSLYLENDIKLADIRNTLSTNHSFNATPKQYKDKFKAWGWQKNLPADVAQFIVKKANDRKKNNPPKETVFVFGGKQWTKERAQMSVRRAKKEQAIEMEVDTPEGISYKTPASLSAPTPENALAPSPRAGHEQSPEAMTISSVSDEDEWDSDEEVQQNPLPLSWNGHTTSDIKGLFELARQNHRDGEADTAEDLFLQAMEGHKRLLSPTHEDTTKVCYTLATFYVEQGRVDDARMVIEESSRAHVTQLGIEHRRTQQHVLNVVELLNGLNMEADALAFLARATELYETGFGRAKTGSQKHQARTQSAGQRQIPAPSHQLGDVATSSISKAADPTSAELDYGISLARTYVQSNDKSAAEGLLQATIRQCPSSNAKLVVQRLKALAELLKLYKRLGTVEENRDWFGNATGTFDYIMTHYPWSEPTREKFKSQRIMEAFLELGAALLKAGFADHANHVFRRSVEKAEEIYTWDDERTIWMSITVGTIYQSHAGWFAAEEWFERALAAALSKYDGNDGIVISLEEAREVHHFSYINDEARPYKTIFGVNGLTIRPTRLHID